MDRRQTDVIIIAVCAVLHVTMIIYSRLTNGVFGFPLDDSWIFQTYARNLIEWGQWAFVPGVQSSGSTSILWTPLLAIGYVLPLSPVLWGYALGLVMYALTALGASRLFDGTPPLLIGLAVAFEWHLLWASGAGMDTILFACLLVWFWVWVKRGIDYEWRHGLLLGVFGGALLLARPEGLLALAVAGLWGLLNPAAPLKKRIMWGALAGAGLALIVVPLFAWNLSISGEIWPSTFYAKQAEYAILWEQPIIVRYLQQASAVHIGGLAVLLPGLLIGLWQALQRRDVVYLLPLLWVLLHWAAYAVRLPVTYQNARYAIPTIPILTAYGVTGMLSSLRLQSRSTARRLISRVWLLLAAITFPASALIWAVPSYADNVAFIQDEMVTSARWIADQRDEGTLVAAHDIGALGYFAPGPLLDLAGLVSPEVVPFINDPARLAAFIVDNQADYVVVFPGWSPAYEVLVADDRLCQIYATDEEPGYEQASENLGAMTVYTVHPDGNCP